MNSLYNDRWIQSILNLLNYLQHYNETALIPPKTRFSPTIKVAFFGFYVNGVTLADGESLPLMREVDFAQQKTEGETPFCYLSPSRGLRRASPLVRGGLLLHSSDPCAIISPTKVRGVWMIKILFVCHGKIPPNFEKCLCL